MAIGIITEFGDSTCMKFSYGFTNVYPSIFTLLHFSISFTAMIFALKHFELSFIYAICAGLEILLVSLIGMLFFN
jgi:small multidrug resistance pump